MEIGSVMNIILVAVFCVVGVALVFFVLELIKTMKTTNAMLEDIRPKIDSTLQSVDNIMANIQPTLAKVDPMMDSLQLTVDALNLEMMRVDAILEDVTDITGAASSATAAVDNITNAPLKAVTDMAARVRSKFGPKNASEESVQLAEQRVAVAQALEDYRAAEKKVAPKEEAVRAEAAEQAPERLGDAPKSYVKETNDGSELVIDPKTIAESPFFDEGPDAR